MYAIRSYYDFQDVLGRVLDTAERDQRRIALMFFDLDRFKAINDTYGHLVGDRVLTVFGLAGVGRMLFEAITARDYPIIQAFTVVIAVV